MLYDRRGHTASAWGRDGQAVAFPKDHAGCPADGRAYEPFSILITSRPLASGYLAQPSSFEK